MTAAKTLSTDVGIVKACTALTVARATYYRRLSASPAPRPRSRPVRALGDGERRNVIDVLTSPRFVDKAPATVFATLLDERSYLCSTRTMYRVLEANRLVRERRDQLRHPAYAKPELLATGANQVWSWDITKLRGAVKWSYFHLYVILDIFSRYVVGWMVAPRETAELASRLIDETIAKEGVPQGQLTIHADRGTSMTSKSVALLLADLGVTKTREGGARPPFRRAPHFCRANKPQACRQIAAEIAGRTSPTTTRTPRATARRHERRARSSLCAAS